MKDLNYETVAKRIQDRRIALGMTYQELANRASMSKSTLQRYETGAIKNIPIARLQALSTALEMEPNELIGIKSPEASDISTIFNSLDAESVQVAQDYMGLDEPGKRIVKVIIKDQQNRMRDEQNRHPNG